MFQKKNLARGVAALLITAMTTTQLFTGMPAVRAEAAEAAQVVTISPLNASTINEGVFEGWGTSFCWWANRLGYSDTLSRESAKLFYNKDEGLGLNIIRYNIGGGDDPSHKHITRTDSEVPGYATNHKVDPETGEYSWEYDWTADANQRNVLKEAMKEAGNEVIVEGFSNSPPYFMTNSGCSTGAVKASEDNLKTECYDDFARYMADVAKQFKVQWGVEFQSITPMNEPYTDYWGANSWKQEGCHFDQGASQSNIIIEMKKALEKNGLGNMIIPGTDETSIDTQITSYKKLSSEAKKIVGRIDTHTYGGSNRAGLKALAESENKNLWMSEVDDGGTAGTNAGEMGAGLWLAQRIIKDMNGMTPSAWILWQIIDNHISEEGHNGNQDYGMPDTTKGFWGTAVADHDKNEIIKTMKYYTFGQFTRYIRPGYQIIAGTENTLAAYDKEGKKLVIVATNTKAQDQSYHFDLSQFRTVGSSVLAVRTSGTMENGEKWKELPSLQADSTGFDASLKANSVTTYIVEDVEMDTTPLTEITLNSQMVTGSEPWNNDPNTSAAKTVDGDLSTFFDGVADGYVQLDLGVPYELEAIGYAPRAGYAYRCLKAEFYGSEDGETWRKLYTITNTPTEGINYVSAKQLAEDGKVRYVKYTVPTGEPNYEGRNDKTYSCNIAELKLFGTASPRDTLQSYYTLYQGIERGYYTAITYNAYTEAWENAGSLLGTEGVSEDVLREAAAALKAAVKGLTLAEDTPVSLVEEEILAVGIQNQTPFLPDKVMVNTVQDQQIAAEVLWDTQGCDFSQAYARVKVTGTVANTDLRVAANVEVIPPDLVYFIDAGTQSAGSDTYDEVAKYAPGLKNAVSDQQFDGANGWGVSGTIDGTYGGTGSQEDKFLNGYYGKNKSQEPIQYTIPLEKGTYNITVQAHEWWSGPRTMKMDAEYMDAGGVKQTVLLGEVTVRENQRDGLVQGTLSLEQDTVVTVKTYLSSGTEAPVVTFLGVAGKYESAVITGSQFSFDKNPDIQGDIQTEIIWNDAGAIRDIKQAGVSIGAQAYAASGSALTIRSEYLAAQPEGVLPLMVEFDHGMPGMIYVTILDTSPVTVADAVLSGGVSVFDKATGRQNMVYTQIDWNDAGFITDIRHNGTTIGTEAFEINGNKLTIKQEYLAGQPVGVLNLLVEFDKGNAALWSITVTDTTSHVPDSSSGGSTTPVNTEKVETRPSENGNGTMRLRIAEPNSSGSLQVNVSINTGETASSENTVFKVSSEYLIKKLGESGTKQLEIKITEPSVSQRDQIQIQLPKELLQAAKENKKKVQASFVDNRGKELYTWSFTGEHLAESQKKISDVNLDIAINQGDAEAQGVVFDFAHEGILPAQADIKAYVADIPGIRAGENVFLYHYNTLSGKLEELPNSYDYTVDKEGYINFGVLHCSDYVILPVKPAGRLVVPLKNQIKVIPAKKVLYAGKKAGRTTKLKLQLPVTLEQVNKLTDKTSGSAAGAVVVSYSTSNKAVAAVNKSGIITAKKAGKAVITIKIKLFNGETKTIKTKITVK